MSKKEITDLIPAQDPEKETKAVTAKTSDKNAKSLTNIKPSKSSLAKFNNFANGKLK